MAELETRTVTATVEYRDDGESGPAIIGHAATFDQPYQVGFFRERLHRDAFKRTLAGSPDVRLLINHEGVPLARTKSGTLTLGTDDRGLTVHASDLDLANPRVAEVTSAMRRGDIDQMSFSFRVPSGGDVWDHTGDMPVRTVREASLAGGDVSVVTYPANENATVALRHREAREAHYTLALAMLDELREGRAVDPDRLKRVLDALQGADTALDGSLAAIADMLGVENSDVDQDQNMDSAGIRSDAPAPQTNMGLPADLARCLAAADALRRRKA